MPMSIKIGSGGNLLRWAPPITSHDPLRKWPREVKSKLLNLPYRNAYGHQTCQGGDIR